MRRRIFFGFIFVAAFARLVAQPSEPVLALNSGLHTAPIRSISTDTEGRYLLTASEDKTARLWDARTGRALRVFRPPVGYGFEGSLYACALSPDGQTAAVGGYTGASWNKADSTLVTVGNWKGYARKMKYSIYLFSTTTGELLMNIDRLEGEIRDLKFSPDGVYLAAALGDAKGVSVLRASDGAEFRKLIGYGDVVRRMAFSASGQLAVVADDNYLRLYSPSFQLIATQPLDAHPSDIAFSPDASTFAVAYDGQTHIHLFKAKSGVAAGVLQTSPGIAKGAVALAYAPDGAVCSGAYLQNGRYHISILKNNRRTDIPAAAFPISAVSALPDGSLVYGTLCPEIGRIAPDMPPPSGWEGLSEAPYLRTAEIRSVPFRQQELFQLNDDGTEIGLKGVNRDVLFFSLTTRTFSTGANRFPRAADRVRDIILSGWKDGQNPVLNGKSLNILQQDEINRCVDVSGNGTRILMGTNLHILCLDGKGGVLWKRSLPNDCVAVKISGNGKVAAAALSNGMYAWFDMVEGVQLFTLFAHPDNSRWALWTPAGYYDCAAGAEDLIGWNLNQGKNKAAAFYPVARFRAAFYRPEMIDRSLSGHAQLAQNAANEPNRKGNAESQNPNIAQTLPPEVGIITPQPESSVNNRQVRVAYFVQSSGKEPVESVKILVDGRPVQLLASVKAGNNEVMVDIPERDCEISVIAKNKFASGVPATVRVKWTGVSEDVFKPKLYVLAVGISRYTDKNLSLQYAAKDANDFAQIMARQKGLLYGDVVTKLLIDKNGTKIAILEGLEWIQRETTSKDVAMIFFAGHGVNDNAGTFFYLPVEADFDRLRSTGVNYMEIKQTVAAVAGKVILFMDACHSGHVMGNVRRSASATDINGIVNELSSAENGVIVFTSSTGRQYSLENAEWNNGAFTKALVEGLGGKADLFGHHRISVKTLDAYITQRVKDLTNGQQAPTTVIPASIPDFPVAITLTN
jgi:WD40 repeat protein